MRPFQSLSLAGSIAALAADLSAYQRRPRRKLCAWGRSRLRGGRRGRPSAERSMRGGPAGAARGGAAVGAVPVGAADGPAAQAGGPDGSGLGTARLGRASLLRRRLGIWSRIWLEWFRTWLGHRDHRRRGSGERGTGLWRAGLWRSGLCGQPNWIAYCSRKYRSFDPRTGTFLGYDGLRHPAPDD